MQRLSLSKETLRSLGATEMFEGIAGGTLRGCYTLDCSLRGCGTRGCYTVGCPSGSIDLCCIPATVDFCTAE